MTDKCSQQSPSGDQVRTAQQDPQAASGETEHHCDAPVNDLRVYLMSGTTQSLKQSVVDWTKVLLHLIIRVESLST